MLKAMSHDIVISETKLIAKSGGKKDFQRDEPAL
jgi:cyclic pyranopterin phosphate synthase